MVSTWQQTKFDHFRFFTTDTKRKPVMVKPNYVCKKEGGLNETQTTNIEQVNKQTVKRVSNG